jgi:site-specific DNA recombinase
MATKCVFISARISKDRTGRAEGVEAQERWGRAYAAEHWPGVPVKVFSDNDLSAADDNVFRPEFEAMREAIRRGECAHLWAVEQNRLTRIESVWFALAGDLVKADVLEVHTKRNGVIDVGGVVAGIMAVLGAHEVRQLKKRVRDKMGELATQGRPPGGSVFGYRKRIYTTAEQQRLDRWYEAFYAARRRGEEMRRWKEDNPRPIGGRPVLDDQGRASMEIVPEQAKVIRQAADWVLDGWTPYEVAAELRNRGVKGAQGGPISGTSVRIMLSNPTLAALRVHQGEVIGKGIWEPILEEPTWRAVRAAVEPRTRRPTRVKPRQFLLTRLAECSACTLPMFGHRLPANLEHGHRKDRHRYFCNGASGVGCGASVSGAQLDEIVIGRFFEHLAKLDLAPADDEHAERRKQIMVQLRTLDANRAEWLRARDAGQLDLGEYLTAKAKFDEEQQRLNVELAGWPAPIERIDAAQLREDWPEMPLHSRRQLLDKYTEKITVQPQPRRLTLKDVAKASGCSAVAVYFAFNPNHPRNRPPEGPRVSEKNRYKILAVAEEMGFEYKPKASNVVDPDRVEIFWR